jgi:hypothetical protein
MLLCSTTALGGRVHWHHPAVTVTVTVAAVRSFLPPAQSKCLFTGFGARVGAWARDTLAGAVAVVSVPQCNNTDARQLELCR